MNARREPFPYQQEAIEHCILRNTLLADKTGLGKTIVCIEAAQHLSTRAGGGRGIIVCRKGHKDYWRQEIIKQYPNARVFVPKDAEDLVGTHTINNVWVIIHYELVVKLWAVVAAQKWLVGIIDEAHNIKNYKAKRTEAIKKALAYCVRKIAATATPWDRNPAELWSLLNWLYPSHWSSYWRFSDEHVEFSIDFLGYKHCQGVKDEKRLAEAIAPITIARTKQEVAPQLPPRIDTVMRVDMLPEQAKLYATMNESKDLLVTLQDQEILITNTLSQIVKLQQLATDPRLLGMSEASGKLQWLADWFEDNPHEPTVVFTTFRFTAHALAELHNGDICTGGIAAPAKAFLEGRKHRLFGTLSAMKEGYNLQRASTAIFLDSSWSSIVMEQAADRIHRIDIIDPKQCIFLVSSEVDIDVHKAFTEKWTQKQLVYKYLGL